jgi:osmoprotectant transport system permease protein
LLDHSGTPTEHRDQLGGTRVLWNALLQDEIQLYPEYTGTIRYEILQNPDLGSFADLANKLRESDIGISAPLGFNNTYALGMLPVKAQELDIKRISDLRLHPGLKFGLTNEFVDRADGWPSLQAAYRLPQTNIRGLDHDLAYRGLAAGSIDVMDLYSTDAEIAYYGLNVLIDDAGHFPEYQAVVLYRLDLLEKFPRFKTKLARIEGQIDATAMIQLNSNVKLQGMTEQAAAAQFLNKVLNIKAQTSVTSIGQNMVGWGLEHLFMVAVSLSAAILIALPLGILASRKQRTGQIILAVVGIIQTIPSLALLVFMIPLLGIGGPPAIVALFLYSLLPIVRNTYTGLTGIPSSIHESAFALGLPKSARMRLIEFPLALPSILGGIKTAAVINVGTATLGALIGAGGFGQPILTGIRLDNTSLILQGAIPAALLALAVQGAFDLAERFLVSPGLRSKHAGVE